MHIEEIKVFWNLFVLIWNMLKVELIPIDRSINLSIIFPQSIMLINRIIYNTTQCDAGMSN